ncbi:putative ubiquitin-conjugating enzyme E2 24 isoform X2 [Canna indica]|uniref:E2 ubiquitin-conjugating enzyme n=1 Tax=Canna indica TaxID=4628 RepID=A0AAQ3JVX4_9LILI|nr:putative ubiquitin-conjugating enzyme E2 24 isoform X2 [Canna indica]
MDVLVIDSDIEIYSETSDNEDLDGSESAYDSHAQIILSSLDESIGKIDSFLSFERDFLHGDVVCSVTDPSGQFGRVVDVDMVVDLETTSGGVIKGINSKKLARVRSFAVGDHVVHGPWIGRVDTVFDVVTVLFDDGAKYEILVRDYETLVAVSPRLEDTPFHYYPGQRVKVNRAHVSKLTSWFCGSKENQDEGTVFHVDIGLVYVSWISSVVMGCGILASSPSPFQYPSNLTLLSYFLYANWQIGDWCRLPVDFVDNLQNVTDAKLALRMATMSSTEMQKELGFDNQEMYVITKTKSKVDVLWQNGERSVGLDPQTLSPVSNAGDHDFWPEQFVMEKVTSEEICIPKIHRLGIVKNVDSYERTVKVKWIVPKIKQTSDFSCESMEETVSAYELIEHPDFSHCIGDVVMSYMSLVENIKENLLDMQSNDQVPWQKLSYLGNNYFLGKEMLEQNIIGSHKDQFQIFLSCIGNVIGYKDELVEVRWASGHVSKVPPYEIFGLDRISSTASLLSSNEENYPANISKETVDQQKQVKPVWNKKEKAAFGFLPHVIRKIFGSSGSISLDESKREVSSYQLLKREELQFDTQDEQLEIVVQEPKETEQSDGRAILPGEDRPVSFNKFDMVNDFSDHHFINDTGNCSQVKRSWFKKVQQEWSILRKDLPDTIYVRVYEERMDIMRAAIVGAPGTPYHDGLFFFDILFPSDYPHVPPVVHYNSGGLRLNPNLYESGKVCLSLLNTWVGTGTEVWNPESSTMLQVLLSLQALVLNDKPYFNEAGYDEEIGKVEGEKNSITYNENAFLQSCKSMLYTLRRPPMHFEALVEEHFAERGHHILNACKAYLEGTKVAHAYECRWEDDQGCRSCSTGFRIMLAKLFPELISAFNQIGADCTQFLN